ncbi:MAG: cysteine--tRNA ligase [Patescibacteria group bacterium]
MLKIYNTLSKKVEEFKPIDSPKVGMYTCGPTVYDYMHIGNLRTLVLSDILLRVLNYNGYRVKSVQNITDIDDKIIKKAKERNEGIGEVAKEFTKYFLEDVAKLNISIEDIVSPRATDYIPQMIEYVQSLIEKKFAYEKDGSVYFDITKFPRYGKLSGISAKELKTGTRGLSDNYTKDDITDFALWKKDDEFGVTSPWGKGRPGWHIECSVMSQANLGDSFDIHAGGVDLIFPHHENEIAQSEAKTGKKFVNYFVHGAHLLVDGAKMSKSLGNFHTLSDLIKRGFEPLALRYLYLQTHYRQEMNFTFEALEAAQTALNRLREDISNWGKPKVGCAEFEERFLQAINNDLNMPEALSTVWELVKSDYPTSAKAESLFKMDQVLGLNLGQEQKLEIPEEIMKMVKEREELRKIQSYHLADQMRVRIKKLGYNVLDTEKGSLIKKL